MKRSLYELLIALPLLGVAVAKQMPHQLDQHPLLKNLGMRMIEAAVIGMVTFAFIYYGFMKTMELSVTTINNNVSEIKANIATNSKTQAEGMKQLQDWYVQHLNTTIQQGNNKK